VSKMDRNVASRHEIYPNRTRNLRNVPMTFSHSCKRNVPLFLLPVTRFVGDVTEASPRDVFIRRDEGVAVPIMHFDSDQANVGGDGSECIMLE